MRLYRSWLILEHSKIFPTLKADRKINRLSRSESFLVYKNLTLMLNQEPIASDNSGWTRTRWKIIIKEYLKCN